MGRTRNVIVALLFAGMAVACSKSDPGTSTAATSGTKPSVPTLEGTVTTLAASTSTVPPTTIMKASDAESSVDYPDGMDCPGTDKATIKGGWGGARPPVPPGNVGGMYDPGPIHVLDSSIVTVNGDRFDVLAVGCGRWKAEATKGAFNLAEGWNRDVTLKLLVYHVTDGGVRDRRTDTQDFTRDWITCGFRNTKTDVSDVYCTRLSSEADRVVVGSVAINSDGKATLTANGTPPPTSPSTTVRTR